MSAIKLNQFIFGKFELKEFEPDDIFGLLGQYKDDLTEVSFNSGKSPVYVQETPDQIIVLDRESGNQEDRDWLSVV